MARLARLGVAREAQTRDDAELGEEGTHLLLEEAIGDAGDEHHARRRRGRLHLGLRVAALLGLRRNQTNMNVNAMI